jgi:hypothetical protein
MKTSLLDHVLPDPNTHAWSNGRYFYVEDFWILLRLHGHVDLI